VPEDVRLTTRFNTEEFLGSLYGTIHETGHGRYQQNLPAQWLGQPVAQARSMAFHESQSLFFEMQLGAHPGFVAQLSPLLIEAFGPQDAFEPENLQRLLTRVKRGFIRVDSDEVTYPAHILLRTKLERALIKGEIEAEDLPSLWDAELEALLGLRCVGQHHQGVMQDIHWPAGLFGYFPCYTLGAMYAAQWFATIEKARPTVHAEIEKGQLEPTFDWLKTNIWQQGSRWTGAELAQRASGETLNPQYFRDHLSRRYLA
jgi:carboxypeptidase Taq